MMVRVFTVGNDGMGAPEISPFCAIGLASRTSERASWRLDAMSTKRNSGRFTLLFLNFLLYGGVTTIVGATLPVVIRHFGWGYLAAGGVIAAGAVGYFATTFLAGMLVGRIGPGTLMTAGLGLQAAGLAAFGTASPVVFNMVALILLGLGQGTTEVGTNYAVVQMEPAGTSRKMNLIHSAFTVGAIAAPLATGVLAGLTDRWRLTYVALAVLSLGMAGALGATRHGFSMDSMTEQAAWAGLRRLVRQPLLWLLAAVILLYVGVEMGVSAWIAEYHVRRFGMAPERSAFMVSVFWLGIFVGRLLTSWLYHGNRPALLLAGFAGLAAAGLGGGLLANRWGWSAGLYWVTGLGLSAIYPLVMAVTGAAFPRQQGIAIGVVTTGGGMGACLFPFLMATLADRMGIQAGFWFYFGLCLLMAFATFGVAWQVARKQATYPATE